MENKIQIEWSTGFEYSKLDMLIEKMKDVRDGYKKINREFERSEKEIKSFREKLLKFGTK